MLVSCVFCRSVVRYEHSAVVSFVENGRLFSYILSKGVATRWQDVFGTAHVYQKYFSKGHCVDEFRIPKRAYEPVTLVHVHTIQQRTYT
jgi:hypothetical protein